jgi:hypothetical protein
MASKMRSNETAADKQAVLRVASETDKALLRMKRASDRGTGCYLTPEMMDALSCTMLAEIWCEAAEAHNQQSKDLAK